MEGLIKEYSIHCYTNRQYIYDSINYYVEFDLAYKKHSVALRGFCNIYFQFPINNIYFQKEYINPYNYRKLVILHLNHYKCTLGVLKHCNSSGMVH